jgi:thymidylate kinase
MPTTYITGCPGVGKTTIQRELTEDLKDLWGPFLDDGKFGSHPADDRSKWQIDTELLSAEMAREPNLVFFSISSNKDEVAKLPWDIKIHLDIPWEEAEPRIKQRLKEKKNNWPATPDEWEITRKCYEEEKFPGFEHVDASGTLDLVIAQLLEYWDQAIE